MHSTKQPPHTARLILCYHVGIGSRGEPEWQPLMCRCTDGKFVDEYNGEDRTPYVEWWSEIPYPPKEFLTR